MYVFDKGSMRSVILYLFSWRLYLNSEHMLLEQMLFKATFCQTCIYLYNFVEHCHRNLCWLIFLMIMSFLLDSLTLINIIIIFNKWIWWCLSCWTKIHCGLPTISAQLSSASIKTLWPAHELTSSKNTWIRGQIY